MMLAITAIPIDLLAPFCQEHGIRRLALFGSALRDDFRPDSDIDLLVSFAPDRPVGLLTITRLASSSSAGRRENSITLCTGPSHEIARSGSSR